MRRKALRCLAHDQSCAGRPCAVWLTTSRRRRPTSSPHARWPHPVPSAPASAGRRRRAAHPNPASLCKAPTLPAWPWAPPPPPCQHLTPVAQTIENTREKDITMVAPSDEEIAFDEADDEFAGEGRRCTWAHYGMCCAIWGCGEPVTDSAGCLASAPAVKGFVPWERFQQTRSMAPALLRKQRRPLLAPHPPTPRPLPPSPLCAPPGAQSAHHYLLQAFGHNVRLPV
jgi:hypothetical protein